MTETPRVILLAKPWLDGNEATALLGHLCNCVVPTSDFIELVGYYEVDTYLDARDLSNAQNGRPKYDEDAKELLARLGDGSTVIIPRKEMIRAAAPRINEDSSLYSFGITNPPPVVYLHFYRGKLEGKDVHGELVTWFWDAGADLSNACAKAVAYFKPSDIQALADTINGTEQPKVDAGETEQLRQRIAELEAQADQQAQRIAELEAEAARTEPGGHTDNGLTFPYTTPELLAMHAAALKYWAEYNAETDRKPLQKEIGLELTEALALKDSSGQPSRQAAALATAIQPEKYRG